MYTSRSWKGLSEGGTKMDITEKWNFLIEYYNKNQTAHEKIIQQENNGSLRYPSLLLIYNGLHNGRS